MPRRSLLSQPLNLHSRLLSSISLSPQGTLRGFDQATNLIVDDCHERVYSSKVGEEEGREEW